MGKHDVTGAWKGFYVQHGGRHGIEMRVRQHGDRFFGRMRDENTLFSSSMTERVAVSTADFVEFEVETMGHLPEHSVVTGTVTGDFVQFEKRYLGRHRVTVWAEGRGEAHYEIVDHHVRYEGRLGADGGSMVGRWLLGPSAPDADDAASGAFELHRDPAKA